MHSTRHKSIHHKEWTVAMVPFLCIAMLLFSLPALFSSHFVVRIFSQKSSVLKRQRCRYDRQSQDFCTYVKITLIEFILFAP